MTGALTFNASSLQTFDPTTRLGILTNRIDHTDLPDYDVNALALANANGSVIPYDSYPSKKISIEGAIFGSSLVDIDQRIDAFKALFNGKNKNLDITYAGGTRRYTATKTSIRVSHKQKQLYATFIVEFIATFPFGLDTTLVTALNQSGRTLAGYIDTHTFVGSAPVQYPLITITFNNVAMSAANLVTNPGFETDTSGWSNYGIAGSSMARTTAQHNTGVAALQITNAGTGSGGVFGGAFYFMTGLTPGVTYTISAFIKGNAGGESVRVNVVNGGQLGVTAGSGWTQVFLSFTATFSTHELDFLGLAASQVFFVDDVSVLANSAAFVSFQNNGNGQGIMVTDQIWTPGDILEIDVFNKTVKRNGTDIDFIGAFPEFAPGAASFSYSDGFLSRSMTELITYNPMYL